MKKVVGRLIKRLKRPQTEWEEVRKIRFFRENGFTPFSEVDFGRYDVTEMNMEPFLTMEQASDLYENLLNVPYMFELYSVPTLINFKKEIEKKDMTGNHTEIIGKLDEALPDEEYIYNRIFLITKKEQSKKVIGELGKCSFNMIGPITKEEANEIEVQLN